MNVEAEPTKLTLPLPGGSQGASVKLFPLLTGEILAPPAFLIREKHLAKLKGIGLGSSKKDWIWLPIPCFLVQHPTAGNILVDTGFHPSVSVDPTKNLGRIAGKAYSIRAEPEQSAPKRLEKMGISPSSIKYVIMTHLHTDHASAISEFPHATFIVGEGEWAAATQPRPLLKGYNHLHIDHAFDYREAIYTGAGVNSYSTFGRTIDLFGDGSIRLCYTPGHSTGHQSVICKLKDREALLVGDAAMVRRNYRELLLQTIMVDEHRGRVSLREIQLYEKQKPNALIIPSHDMEVWQELQPGYE